MSGLGHLSLSHGDDRPVRIAERQRLPRAAGDEVELLKHDPADEDLVSRLRNAFTELRAGRVAGEARNARKNGGGCLLCRDHGPQIA